MIEESDQQASDRRLLADVASGNQTAFEQLYDRLSSPLYSLCLRMTGEAQEAEDILQEVCMVIWRRAGSYDPERSSVFSWAVHLTRCKTIDHLRSRGRRLRVFAPVEGNGIGSEESAGAVRPMETAATDAPTAADALDRNERAEKVRRVLGSLPVEQSQAIEMAFFSDLSHYEISARLAQPLGTVKARIRRGLLKLREDLQGGTGMISELQQEQATLYALGLLDADEATAFELELAADAELQALVRDLRDTSAALALLADEPVGGMPAGLKNRVLHRIAAENQPRLASVAAGEEFAPATRSEKIIRPRFGWVPWTIAALLLGCTVLLTLSREALVREVADVRRLAAVPAPTPAEVFSRVAFCELEPTPNAPAKPRASVLWDTVQHRGKLHIRQFAPPTQGKDYQLWAVENARKEPVNAGVVHVDAEGRADVTFQPDAIPGDNQVVALAISLEQAGGSPTNQGPILYVGKL